MRDKAIETANIVNQDYRRFVRQLAQEEQARRDATSKELLLKSAPHANEMCPVLPSEQVADATAGEIQTVLGQYRE
jgi:hypothetical protein